MEKLLRIILEAVFAMVVFAGWFLFVVKVFGHGHFFGWKVL